MPRGGARPGSGRKKGSKWPSTLDKEAAREAVRTFVIAHLQPMIEAQIANACGLKYLVARNKKTGKFRRLTEAMDRTRLGKNTEIIEVWTKDPSVQAFTDLLNRAIGKPAEQEAPRDVNATDWDKLAARLASARQEPVMRHTRLEDVKFPDRGQTGSASRPLHSSG